VVSMVKFGYSYNKAHDPTKVARAMGRDMRISPKDAVEVCNAIKGRDLDDALDYLEGVAEGLEVVPYKRYFRKISHKRSLQGWHSGKSPLRASEAILELLENAQSNAKYKGMDETALFVRHASARRGFTIRGFRHRARGRVLAFDTPTANVEIWLGEK
jgi:large subunit ribosomal protein L22